MININDILAISFGTFSGSGGGGGANSAPTATGVAIDNTTPTEGDSLTGSYTYNDVDGDLEGTSTFRWLRDDVAIGGATAQTYTVVLADVGAVLKFEVTPVALTGETTGTPVESTGTTPVVYSVYSLDTYFDAIWLPEDAKNSGGTVVSDGEVVDQFVDRVRNVNSGVDLDWTGVTTQRTGFSGPTYHDLGGNNKFVWFPNLQNIIWEESAISPTEAAPQTVLLVFRRLPSWDGESILKSGGAFNFKDGPGGGAPLYTPTYYQFDINTDKAASNTGGDWGGVNKIVSALVQYDSGNEALHVNGVSQSITGTIANSDWNDMAIGTATNLMACELFYVGIKSGSNFTAGERTEIDAIVDALWTRNSVPSDYDSTASVTVQTDGSGATRDFYLSDDGGTTDWVPPVGTTIQWHEAGDGAARSFSDQNHITGATGVRITRADYTGVFVSHPSSSNVWITAEISLPNVPHVIVVPHAIDNVDPQPLPWGATTPTTWLEFKDWNLTTHTLTNQGTAGGSASVVATFSNPDTKNGNFLEIDAQTDNHLVQIPVKNTNVAVDGEATVFIKFKVTGTTDNDGVIAVSANTGVQKRSGVPDWQMNVNGTKTNYGTADALEHVAIIRLISGAGNVTVELDFDGSPQATTGSLATGTYTNWILGATDSAGSNPAGTLEVEEVIVFTDGDYDTAWYADMATYFGF